MKLPEYVLFCVSRLEEAGFAAYAVGGCVRDAALGLEPHDYDLCTAATPEQTEEVFSDFRLVLAGKKHGTVGVVMEGQPVEITTFRTEGGYDDSRHPGWVRFVPTIEEDLSRRDFTVNAMAYSPTRGYADPFGGRADLQNGVLRAVGNPEARFQEDALRILRGMRFAVRYGLTPEENTLKAMFSHAPLLDKLARERIFDELCKLLPLVRAEDLLAFTPIFGQVIPELQPMVGFDQHNPHHAFDLFTHTAHVTGGIAPELPLRWAALLHDIGKVPTFTLDETGRGHFLGHAQAGAEMADGILRRLKAPTALRERVVFLIGKQMTPLEPDRKLLRRRLSQYGPEAVWQLLALQRADFTAKGVSGGTAEFDRIAELLRELEREDACLKISDLAVNGRDLMALGYPAGKELGACLQTLLSRVLEDELPNTRNALLAAAEEMLRAAFPQ